MRIPLVGGAYTARSVIAEAQRCLNLYPESNPQDAPTPVTHYPTPGLRLLATAPVGGVVRGLYRFSNGLGLIAVVGNKVYYVSPSWVFTLLGTIGTTSGQVSIADNGTTAVLVDGSASGYTINLNTNAFATISDPAFYGADRVEFLDTYLLFNKPGTPQFYTTTSNVVTPFDATYFANKSGYADPLVGIAIIHREIWLIGQLTTEVWYNVGGNAFPFARLPGTFIEQGCVAKYSIAKADTSVFWLSQNLQGELIVLQGENYQAKRVSTHAIESAWAGYPTVSDAIAFTYQQMGHLFYVLTFPTVNKTWCYDMATGLWHERAYTGPDGLHEGRHLANCHSFVYNTNVVGDYSGNGQIYAFDPAVYTDNTIPIMRRRGFPHLVQDGKRIIYRALIADMEVGTDTNLSDTPLVSLRWSDTRGQTWNNPVTGSMGQTGQYLTSIQWQRLGYARDRCFELFWSANVQTALQGAFIQIDPCSS
jgi:hypothetical protein